MWKAVLVSTVVVLVSGYACVRLGQNLGENVGQNVISGGMPLQHQVLVPKETLAERRLRHMTYFDSHLFHRTYGVAD